MEHTAFILIFIVGLTSCSATYYTHKYMDDSSVCQGSTVIFSSFSQGTKVSAWNPYSVVKSPFLNGCKITIGSYGLYGMKYKFTSNSYISSTDVTFNVYAGSSTFSSMLASYSLGDNFPTYYTYTDSDYITIKLDNPSKRTAFGFTIIVENYDNLHTSWNVGDTIGIAIGSAAFVIFAGVIILCIRRRRIAARVAIVQAEAPVSQVTTSAQINYPVAQPPAYPTGQAPYPGGNSPYQAPGAAYPAATTAMLQP